MGAMASQITSLALVYSTVYSDADQRKHQSSASLAFVRRIHRGPVNSPHKWPVTRKMFPFDDVIMTIRLWVHWVAMAINTRGYCQAITVMYTNVYRVRPKNDVKDSRLVMFSCGLVHVNLTNIIQCVAIHWENGTMLQVPVKQPSIIQVGESHEFTRNWS